jgi:hypothetical protein
VLTLMRIFPEQSDWDRMDAAPDRVIFQTREWLEFVTRTQGAEPVIAQVLDDGEPVGYFTGLVIRRFGVRILGSPFPGWTTAYLGFNLGPGVSRRDAATALVDFAYGPLRCAHLELHDRHLGMGELDGLGFASRSTMTFEVDLGDDESAVFGRMSSACRRAVRKAEKSRVTVEVASGVSFADEYHEQLTGVFARQGLVPTYGVDRVRALIRCLEPTGRLVLLRALAPDGRSIATGIFPAYNGTAYFWGGASVRADQVLRPNEAVFWFAMRYWRDRGVTALDMGGGGEYKRRYGGRELWLPYYSRSRFAALSTLRDVARFAVSRRQAWAGRRAGRAAGESVAAEAPG